MTESIQHPRDGYHHGRKAGNPGDLFKHAVLAHLLALLARPGEVFIYAESHAGYPLYTLMGDGEWREGVGRYRAVRHGLPSFSALRPYERHALGDPPRYPGSSELARRVVSGAGGWPRLRLWDRSAEVTSALESHFGDTAVVHTGDGYRGIATVERADLVLLDPISLESVALVETMGSLARRGIPFLCWTPLRGDETGREKEEGRRFAASSRGGFAVERALWERWGPRTCGCQLTATSSLGEALAEAAGAVRRAMGWRG